MSTTTDGQVNPGRRGRPPAPGTEARILAATREILADGGVRSLTMEGVAARAGVAKTTVYRRYRSRDDLALAVLIDMVRTVTAGPEVADVRTELVHILRATLDVLRATLMGRVMQGLVSELAVDPRLSEAFREQVVALRVEDVAGVLARAAERGQLRPDLDVGLVHELLFGPIYYRLFLSGEPLEPSYADRIVDAVLPALEAQRPL
ncbi:MAG TPA: TetR/AcrR family transcriptional regulator [Kineosporiaceae bacterium]|nr:TetR/AcrR family transcriptional regulator [Kineosporiaceae bacterium]